MNRYRLSLVHHTLPKAAGRGVEDVARDLGISDQTIYSWRHQDRIDMDLRPA